MFARNDNDGFTGLLRHDACSLTGLQEDAELYIRHRYAANIKSFLQQVNACPPPPQRPAAATRSSGGQRYETVVDV
jgi:hypothetical protein